MTYALVNIASTTTCIDRSRANRHLATVRLLFSLATVSIFLMHIAGGEGGGGVRNSRSWDHWSQRNFGLAENFL